LKRLMLEMYAMGLFTRDIEEAIKESHMGKVLVSKNGVSEKWRRVKMSEYDITIVRNLRKLYG